MCGHAVTRDSRYGLLAPPTFAPRSFVGPPSYTAYPFTRFRSKRRAGSHGQLVVIDVAPCGQKPISIKARFTELPVESSGLPLRGENVKRILAVEPEVKTEFWEALLMMNRLALTCSACGQEDSVLLPKDKASLSCSRCGASFPGLRMEVVRGFVYILSNASMPGLLKIGMTENDVFERAAELSASTGVPEPYKVEAYTACPDPRQCEASLHAVFESKRKPSREFFELELVDAIAALRKVGGRSPDFLSDRARTCCFPDPPIAPSRVSAPPRAKKEWKGSFVKVLANCTRCGRSYSVDYRARALVCDTCGSPLSYAK
jgi:DNA-directed RNA polymerase subunit RPC12/RpoP